MCFFVFFQFLHAADTLWLAILPSIFKASRLPTLTTSHTLLFLLPWLIEILQIQWAYSDSAGSFSHLEILNLITYTKFHFPNKVTYSQVWKLVPRHLQRSIVLPATVGVKTKT